MKTFFIWFFELIVLVVLNNSNVNAQNDSLQRSLYEQIYLAAIQEYGIDHELINGICFENRYFDMLGHPFLGDNYFKKGNVVYHGKLYSGLYLTYDIYEQKLLYEFSVNEFQMPLYLAKEFISEFTLLNKKFIKRSIPGEQNERFYQLIGEGLPVKTLYRWEKIVLSEDYPSVKFSHDRKTSYLVINNNIEPYKGRNSFIGKFPKQYQKKIKQYIKENKIHIKFCNDNEMELLLKYCSSICNTVIK